MQILDVLLLITLCVLVLDGLRVGWIVTRPTDRRSRDTESKENHHGTA
jgi:hypothetical protein